MSDARSSSDSGSDSDHQRGVEPELQINTEINADAATETTSRPEADASESRIETGRACDDCGAHVTHAYHRVFCDNDGALTGCMACKGHGADRGGRR